MEVISIHPPRGGWDVNPEFLRECLIISIHPPRGGWDQQGDQDVTEEGYFNPPTPWGVGRWRGTRIPARV